MDRYQDNIRDIIYTPFWSTFYYRTKSGAVRPTWRFWRWMSVIVINIAFFISYHLDVQLLEGTMNGSRLLGFHLIDLFTAIETWAATHVLHTNMIIGSVTIAVFYLLVGGKSFCAWACPYGVLSEIGEAIHMNLVRKKIIKERNWDPRIRFAFWAAFIVLTAIDGFLIFEVINPIGIISRIIVYGWSLAIVWVLLILLFEIFYSRRAWCRYICPVGTTYNLLGWASATRVQWDMDKCDHCGACLVACFEDHVIEFTKPKHDKERKEKGVTKQMVVNGDCTLCARCFDVCHTDAYSFNFRLKDLV
ncbi:NapH/MauN family ferredoxin-type protein [Hydrogenimonas sp.]